MGRLVNKFIWLQRLFMLLYSTGVLFDFSLRLYAPDITNMTTSTVCSLWMMFYKFMIYLYQTSALSTALIRLFCIRYPILYHNRYPTEYSKKMLFFNILKVQLLIS